MDRYVRGPTLGKGTFGEVYMATNKEVGLAGYCHMGERGVDIMLVGSHVFLG